MPHPLDRALVPLALVVASALVCVAAPARAVCNQSGLFTTGTSQPTAGGPNRLGLVDVNHDGKADLIATVPDLNVVSVRLGNGDGSFGARLDYSVGLAPEGVALGDFNGDGNLDIVTASHTSNTVSVLRGAANGTFSGRVDFAAGPGPYGVTARDLNSDGILDLVVADNSSPQVSVLMGQGSGGVGNGLFASPVSYTIAGLGIAVATGDFNGDGKVDLAATANFNGTSVLLGNGDGTFQSAVTYDTGAQATFVVVRDFDGDGKQDLAVTNTNFGGIAIVLGNGTGAFGAPTIYVPGLNMAALVIDDFNGDGIPDIAGTSASTSQVEVLLGHATGGVADGTFTFQAEYAVPQFPLGIAGADLNGDGSPDLAAAGYQASAVGVLLGACVTPPPPPPAPGPPHLVSVRDVPNDQGGRVFLRWTRSSLDTVGKPITGYRVWRRLPLGASVLARAQRAAADGDGAIVAIARAVGTNDLVGYWEALATLPAEGLPGYGYAAATTQDSLPGSNPYTAFFVTAVTANAAVFYQSNVDSGYSVDNLAPPAPVPFTVTFGPDANTLHWAPSTAADLAEYRLYRGPNGGFTPDASTLVAATRDDQVNDAAGSAYYKLEVVDVHGNASHFAMVYPEQTEAQLASVVSIDASANRVQVTWLSGGNAGLAASVFRRTADSDWQQVGTVTADGAGYLRYADDAVASGGRYGYRLSIVDAGEPTLVGETWTVADAPRFALVGAMPNPARVGQVAVQFVLPSAEAARLELFDLGGRRLASRDVGALGAGRHVVNLAQGTRVPPGLYLVRLRQGSQVRTIRATVLN